MRMAGKLLVTVLVSTALFLPVSPAQGAVAPAPGRSVIFLRQGQTFRSRSGVHVGTLATQVPEPW